jgi:uncharacterized protein (TIGR01777 family)
MVVVIAGGTGFLGRALQDELRRSGHEVRVLTRGAAENRPAAIVWPADGTVGPWARVLDDADAVVNLAGAGIADARWTPARKALLVSSRILSTRSLVLGIEGSSRRPALINASGIGYYGDRGAQVVTEDTPAGSDFLASICVDWEREALKAASATRVVVLRNGLVMDPTGGALGKMLVPFRLGVGGPLGPGTQYLPWIHIADWLALVIWTLEADDARGPFNVTAPNPVTNAEFTRTLGRAVNRPAIMPVPGFALRIALGELAETLLTGQRAVPKRAEQLGFTFRFREIEPALNDLLR